MIACAFAELLVGGCLEVKEIPKKGRMDRVFRALADIDTELLGPLERLVVECLDDFRSLEETIRLAVKKLTERKSPANFGTGPVSFADACLMEQAGEVIDEALEYLPPTCGCSL